VLRLKSGQNLILFDGSGAEWDGQIIHATKHKVDVELLSKCLPKTESALEITLLQSISRSQRMDFVMQKATELGVKKIIPVISQNTVVRLNESNLKNKIAHWKKIIISAAEQSGRVKLPTIIKPIPFSEELLNEYKSPGSYFLDTTGDSGFSSKKISKTTIVVGPEGGFTVDEKQIAIDTGYKVVKTGPRLLRTETAPIMAISILQYLYGDFSN
jgi:16S rRNA (uracil1498-N3)-methyltransferase